ncbi:MAG TPA: tRNA (guanosine(37)-N1)-methyltransferase TrmD [Candidatus Desulfofervidus auxilii]|uniref:tRNA (guanine-N(1)-)-methyltransferase n=1 Tax=Desulfofervidus auxilii TaxID=1621989 RepID=A0A7V0NE77_DESA2|nr:tRNA (guanosine(37)-N1)-methyltransferase TrmD [Candidatus Desulfofervidus auxilii]
MIFTILTLFPEFFNSPFKISIIGRAIRTEKIKVKLVNIRDFTTDKHRTTDDVPYGGGEGMVMKPEPIIRAIKSIKKKDPNTWVILLNPQGRKFNQKIARELSKMRHLLFICGHYEGIDERVGYFVDDEISIGDFVLTGGEAAALCIIDAVARLVPGVVGKSKSILEESFERGLLEYPQYTRPREYAGYKVPEVLLSGHHENIALWRRRQSILRTLFLRPDLLFETKLTQEDKRFLKEICEKLIKDERE